jgi:hypothetical protein
MPCSQLLRKKIRWVFFFPLSVLSYLSNFLHNFNFPLFNINLASSCLISPYNSSAFYYSSVYRVKVASPHRQVSPRLPRNFNVFHFIIIFRHHRTASVDYEGLDFHLVSCTGLAAPCEDALDIFPRYGPVFTSSSVSAMAG